MKRFGFDDCVKEGLLRRVPASRERANSSMSAAERWLEEAEKSMEVGAFNSSVLASYLAMFHSARAILYSDGYREKSHYCIARYLEEKYVKNQLLENKWVDLLDHQRELRHAGQYDTTFITTIREAENT